MRIVSSPARVKRYPANKKLAGDIISFYLKQLVSDLDTWKSAAPQRAANHCCELTIGCFNLHAGFSGIWHVSLVSTVTKLTFPVHLTVQILLT